MAESSVLSETVRIAQIELFEVAGSKVSLATVLVALLVLGGSVLLSQLLQRGTERTLRRRLDRQEGTILAATRLVHYATLLVGFAVALKAVGIDLGALFAAGAIFAVGLGFAMQSIAQNFVSGVILLVERSIKPGDVVEVEDQIVRISQMGIRATIVETRDGENVIVPNSILIQSAVKNFTLNDDKYRIRISVGVTYSSDMDRVMLSLLKVAREVSEAWGSAEFTPQVVMTGFGDNSVNFDVGVWTTEPWNFRIKKSELLEAVWEELKLEGITIAFPQLDVHFDPELLEALAAKRARHGRS